MSSDTVDRKIAVIFVADVVGYSKHMEKDEDATLKAYGECEKILKKLLKKVCLYLANILLCIFFLINFGSTYTPNIMVQYT